MDKGIIIKAISGFYYVSTPDGIIECKARGVFRKIGDSPLVGDRVSITVLSNGKGIVEDILQRRNFLNRPPVANVDKLFIVSAFSVPAPSPLVIDSMTAVAEDKGIEPVIVFNKCDMGDFTEIAALYKGAGFKTYVVSAAEHSGIDDLLCELSNSVSVFAGNTGVGKSTLLNLLLDGVSLKTGEVSEKLGRGRHTTRHVELFPLKNGGFVADTPGFSSLDVERENLVYKENLQFAFRDFEPYIGKCRFTSCTHTGEKGCAIASALQSGKIAASRYESYTQLYSALAQHKDWEIRKEKK